MNDEKKNQRQTTNRDVPKENTVLGLALIIIPITVAVLFSLLFFT